jgi:hypothetical protein
MIFPKVLLNALAASQPRDRAISKMESLVFAMLSPGAAFAGYPDNRIAPKTQPSLGTS